MGLALFYKKGDPSPLILLGRKKRKGGCTACEQGEEFVAKERMRCVFAPMNINGDFFEVLATSKFFFGHFCPYFSVDTSV